MSIGLSSINFKGNTNSKMVTNMQQNLKNAEQIPSDKSELNDKNNNGKKVAGAILGLAAVAGLTFMGIVKKHNSNMSFEKFIKQGNKFIDGKAVTKDGKNFTGMLEKARKDGTKCQVHYENGKLVRSDIIDKNRTKISKIYEDLQLDPDCTTKRITTYNNDLLTWDELYISKRNKTPLTNAQIKVNPNHEFTYQFLKGRKLMVANEQSPTYEKIVRGTGFKNTNSNIKGVEEIIERRLDPKTEIWSDWKKTYTRS